MRDPTTIEAIQLLLRAEDHILSTYGGSMPDRRMIDGNDYWGLITLHHAMRFLERGYNRGWGPGGSVI